MPKNLGQAKDQSAALAWRRQPDGSPEVLLITSRETRRWVIPKGWPIKGLKPAASAAQEALEEAGVVGVVEKSAVGAYHYDKRLRTGRIQHVRVAVFALEVTEERANWPEMHEREKLWTSPAEAAALVEEPELQALIRDFHR
jgi:8-oxo-dGTP pyrophosphatase MutT (NUDIX family)